MQYIEPYNSYIFAAGKIFVGQKSSLPAAGKFFGGSEKKRGGERDEKSLFWRPKESLPNYVKYG